MTTPSSLRAAGFTVEPAAPAGTCTVITSSKPFWYFNTNFCKTAHQICEGLIQARANVDETGFELLFAGAYADGDFIPFEIVDASLATRLLEQAQNIRDLQLAAAERQKRYNEELAEHAKLLANASAVLDGIYEMG